MAIKKYIIHLEDHVDRKRDFLSNNPGLSDLVWTAGTKGACVDRTAMIAAGDLAPGAEMVDGALGNAVSLIRLLRLCIDTGEIVTILENDAILAHEFDRHSLRLMESIHFDFDIIQWGWNFDSVLYLFPMSRALGPVEIRARQEFVSLGYREFQEWKCERTLILLGHQWGSHCLTVTPQGARNMLELLLPLSTEPFFREDLNLRIRPKSYDSMLGRYYPKLKAFTCFPPLSVAVNDKSKSTIWEGSAGVSRSSGIRRLRQRIRKSLRRVWGDGRSS